MADSSRPLLERHLQYLLGCGMLLSALCAKGQNRAPAPEDRLNLSVPVTTYFSQNPTQPSLQGSAHFAFLLNYDLYAGRKTNLSVGFGINQLKDGKTPFGQLEVDIRELCDQRNFFSFGVKGGFYHYYTRSSDEQDQGLKRHTMGNLYARCNIWNDNNATFGIQAGIGKALVLDNKFIPTLGLILNLKKSGP